MTFLELCREVISDTGLAGGDPTQLESVLDQEGDLARVVIWVRNGCLQVDNLWKDWNYLWFEHVISAAANGLETGSQVPTMPAGLAVRQWDRAAFYLDYGSDTPLPLKYLDWRAFRERFRSTPQTGTPGTITVRPDNTLMVESIADGDYAFRGEGWKRPTVLTNDDDEPDMPEDYHRIIVCRAKISYADKEDVPEILEGAQAEYTDILDKLQSDQLDSFQMDRMAGQDIDLSQETPGFQSGGSLYTTR